MKGFDGDIGLERYKGFKTVNMGSQVPTEELIDRAVKENADAILLSKVVSQKDIHISDMRDLIARLKKRGLEGKFILVAGGPRVTHKMALELGYDAGFTIGAKPSDVANFLYEKMVERMDKGQVEPSSKSEPKSGKKKSDK
jgi:beta-lysine 5,6-aminomutase beta subunit